jgi:ABC-type transporter lipoprotein component MlaA
MAYFMVTRLGNNDLTQLLTHIEENVWKIFYNLENIKGDFEQNLKIIYKHFYNYLPQFMGNSFQGIGLIFDVGADNLQLTKEAGIELGYFF